MSKSSRSRSGSKNQSISKSLVGNSVEVPEEKEGSSDDSKGEKSPIFLNVQNLMTGSLRNPFSAEENYDESCVYIKIEKINNISMPSKTIRYPKIFNTITISKFRTSRDFDTESVGSSLNVRKNWYVTS